MEQIKKPSEKLASYEGKVIEDSLGRKLTLKQPDLLDLFDLTGAMGKEAENDRLYSMAMMTAHISKINNDILVPATSYNQVRANIKRMDFAGFNAVSEFLSTFNSSSEQEEIEKIKK